MSDLNILNWNTNQFAAAGKHVISAAGGGLAVAVAFHFLTPAQSGDISENISLISGGLVKVVTGITGIVAVLAPIISGLRAAHNASPASQVSSVIQNLSAPQITQAANAVADPTSRVKLIEAVADMPEVKKIVPVDPQVAIDTTSPKVTKS